MIEYDKSYVHPAPVVEVEVANPYRGKSRKLRGKIDTAADMSAIPTELHSKLMLEWSGKIGVRGFNQERLTEVKTCRVDILIENHKFELVEVVLTPNSYVLIGRDILNRLKILLDGKNLQLQFIE